MIYDLNIKQGADFYTTLTLQDSSGNPIDLTHCLMSGFIRSNFYATGVLANLNVAAIAPASGQLSLSMSSAVTATIPVDYTFYDVNLYNTGTQITSKIIYGKVATWPQITY